MRDQHDVVTRAPAVDHDADVLEGLFRRGRLQVSQTPLVEIATGTPLAVRLVAHGPADDPDTTPSRLRHLVAASDQVAFLDVSTRARALADARSAPMLPWAPMVLDAHLASFSQLTDNVDPNTVVLVIDSRDALERPAEMLRLVSVARGQGWEIGLREVGSTPGSLAAVSVVEPALVVLSRRVLDEPTSQLSVETLQTVTAFGHSSGALVAAEEVADAAMEATAVAAGATLACGPYYANRVRAKARNPDALFRLFTPPLPVPHHSPFELAARRHTPRRATKPVLVALSQRLESVTAQTGCSSVVLSAFQTVSQVTPETVRRYQDLGRRCTLVMAAAQGLRGIDAPGVSATSLDSSDPLINEWNVLVLTPTMSAMLAASDLRTPARHQRDRQFDYILTYDRDLVAHAARSMLSRLTHRADPVGG